MTDQLNTPSAVRIEACCHCSEVEVDTLTGDHHVVRTNIVMNVEGACSSEHTSTKWGVKECIHILLYCARLNQPQAVD